MVEESIFTASVPPLYVVFGICVGIASLYSAATRDTEPPIWPMVLLFIAGCITLLQAVGHVMYGVCYSAPKEPDVYVTIQSLVHVAVLLVLLVIFPTITFFVRYNEPKVNSIVLESSSPE